MKALFLIKELAFHEPLGLMAMSAFLKQLGVDCKAFITSEEKNLMEKIKKYNPDLILFSATTGIHKFYLELCRQIKKEMKFISIFGGSHPTFYPDFIEEKGVDIVVRGEVEEVLPDFIKNLKSRKSIEKTPGFWVKNKDNKIFRNEIKSYPQDLDKLPFPDRTLLKDYEYLLPKGEKFFISNRGCPYECTYCFNSFNKKLAKGNYVRWRSPQNVIKEIKEVQKSYNIEKINFQDDIFITNKVWLKEFLKLYREEINLPFYCHIRPDLATEEVVKDLKDSNCYCAVFGLESGNDYIRNTVLKRNMSKRDIVNASALLRKYKVNFTTQTMMCLPDETIDMVFETIKLSAKCKPNYINLYFFQPYPGTELADYSISKGLFDGDYNALEHTYHAEGELDIPIKIKDKDKFKMLSDIFRVCVRMPFIIDFIKLDMKYIPYYPISRSVKLALKGAYFAKYKVKSVKDAANNFLANFRSEKSNYMEIPSKT